MYPPREMSWIRVRDSKNTASKLKLQHDLLLSKLLLQLLLGSNGEFVVTKTQVLQFGQGLDVSWYDREFIAANIQLLELFEVRKCSWKSLNSIVAQI